MAQLDVENRTAVAFEPLFLADEEGRPLLVPVVKATFELQENRLRLAEAQVPVSTAGETWGTPGESSYRYEPEVAFFKPATEKGRMT